MLEAGTVFSASWSVAAVARRHRLRRECQLNAGPTRSDGADRFGSGWRDLSSRPPDSQIGGLALAGLVSADPGWRAVALSGYVRT
jgi:hypothetical protein